MGVKYVLPINQGVCFVTLYLMRSETNCPAEHNSEQCSAIMLLLLKQMYMSKFGEKKPKFM